MQADDDIQVHRGHDLESGLLERVREWTDLFPWWRLMRTLRIAASPPMLLLTTITLVVWFLGMQVGLATLSAGRLEQVPLLLIRQQSLLSLAWTILIWAPPAIVLTRQGGLLTAGRSMASLRDGMSLGFRRSWRGWFAGAMPVLGTLVIALLILPAGWLAGFANGHEEVEVPMAILSALIAIPCGVIAFGALFAIPLSWAALGNEQDHDPLNALSRGFEAIVRRPLHLAFYLFLAWLMLWVVGRIAWGVSISATMVCNVILSWSGCSPDVMAFAGMILTAIPAVVTTTLGWGLVGGIYLLLRYDTGGQEVEDIWQQPSRPTPPLPEIPNG